MKIFVIMQSQGEYSDRSVCSVGYTDSEEKAKAAVIRLTKEAQHEAQIQYTQSNIHAKGFEIWKQNNPAPVFNETKPAFDQSKHKDKEYVAAHTERKWEFDRKYKEFMETEWAAWFNDQNEFLDKYVKENFDPLKLDPVDWTDSNFWYEENNKIED